MSLEGAEFAAKITGAGAKQIAVLLYSVLRDQHKTKGKTRLANMIRGGKELKVFAVKDADLQRFCTEAKKYGVLYCVLKDKNAGDGITDIMVRAEDASKINRIFERFNLATVDIGNVKSEIERDREEKAAEDIAAPENARQEDRGDAFLDELLSSEPNKDEAERTNPTEARTERSRPSEPTSTPKEPTEKGASDEPQRKRPSVRLVLSEIKDEQKQKAAEQTGQNRKPKLKLAEHKHPPKKKIKKHKER